MSRRWQRIRRYALAIHGLANTYVDAWLEPHPATRSARSSSSSPIIDRAQSLAQSAVVWTAPWSKLAPALGPGFELAIPAQRWNFGIRSRVRAESELCRRALRPPALACGPGTGRDCVHEADHAARSSLPASLRLIDFGKAYFFVGSYEQAAELIRSANLRLPGHLPSRVMLAAVSSHLGREEEARAAAEEVMRIKADFTIAGWVKVLENYGQGIFRSSDRRPAQGWAAELGRLCVPRQRAGSES